MILFPEFLSKFVDKKTCFGHELTVFNESREGFSDSSSSIQLHTCSASSNSESNIFKTYDSCLILMDTNTKLVHIA